jgi:hypothetical protein
MMLSDFEDYLQLERQRQAWLHGDIDRYSPFNSRHRYGSCSTCIDHPYRQTHICQCEQFLQLAPLVRDNCDCLDCPSRNMYRFDEGLYSVYGG